MPPQSTRCPQGLPRHDLDIAGLRAGRPGTAHLVLHICSQRSGAAVGRRGPGATARGSIAAGAQGRLPGAVLAACGAGLQRCAQPLSTQHCPAAQCMAAEEDSMLSPRAERGARSIDLLETHIQADLGSWRWK